MNLTKFDLQGNNNQLCSLNKEIVQNLGVPLCDVGKIKTKILLPIIFAVIDATTLFVALLFVFGTMMSPNKKRKALVLCLRMCSASAPVKLSPLLSKSWTCNKAKLLRVSMLNVKL